MTRGHLLTACHVSNRVHPCAPVMRRLDTTHARFFSKALNLKPPDKRPNLCFKSNMTLRTWSRYGKCAGVSSSLLYYSIYILFKSCVVIYCQPLCRVSSGSRTGSVEAIHILSALPSYVININNHTQLTRCCSWTVYYPTCGRKLLNLPDLFLTGVLNETRARFWTGFSTQFTLMILKGSLQVHRRGRMIGMSAMRLFPDSLRKNPNE